MLQSLRVGKWENAFTADNYEDDPTHLIALGGFLEAIPVINGSVQPVFFAEAEPAATVTVNVVVFNQDVGVDPVRSLDDAGEWKAVAERFAQVGVKINYTIRYGVDPPFALPTGVNFLTAAEKITVPPFDIEINTPTAEMRQLILDTPLSAADYNVFYVTQMRAGIGTDPDQPARGVAYFSGAGGGWEHPENAPYLNNAFVSSQGAAEATLLVAAHELGHLLTNAGHYGGAQSLMTNQAPMSDDRSATGTKRLDSGRQAAINQNLGIAP